MQPMECFAGHPLPDFSLGGKLRALDSIVFRFFFRTQSKNWFRRSLCYAKHFAKLATKLSSLYFVKTKSRRNWSKVGRLIVAEKNLKAGLHIPQYWTRMYCFYYKHNWLTFHNNTFLFNIEGLKACPNET